jgi:hypothetical protein
MDDKTLASLAAFSGAEPALTVVDGIEVASFHGVVARLCADYPDRDVSHVEAVVLREWEAFTAGRPLVVPTAVEIGAREILDQTAP